MHWSLRPDGSSNVIIKIEATYFGTDGKKYTSQGTWNERLNWNDWNANKDKQNILYRWTSSSQMFCENKLIGVVHWRRQLTYPANGNWVPAVDID